MLNDQFNIIIICGAKGTGKTTFAIELLSKSKRKTAIIDMLDHQSYRHIPIMPTTHLAAWKTGIYRLISSEPLSLLEEINNKVWDANLILEDAHRYLSQNMSKNEIRLFYESKQHGFDIVVMYHAVSQIPPDLYRISDKLVLFKTKDTFKSSTYNKFYNKTEIENAHAKVMRSKSPHAKTVINL
ncbi:MAG: hypothetical protein H6553_06700 [Chitinophagales bacterium]|nr:hypothetical protein [Chitinophagales bacterium]